MRALLDCDGVLAGFDEHLFARCLDAGHHFNIASLEEQTERYLTDHVELRTHRTQVRDWIDGEGWFRALPVIPGAQDGVEAMRSLDWEVWVVTKPISVSPTCMAEKAAWIGEHFPHVDGLVMVPDKAAVDGTFLLDDAPKLEWLDSPPWVPVLYDRPYNQPGSKWGRIPYRFDWSRPVESIPDMWSI